MIVMPQTALLEITDLPDVGLGPGKHVPAVKTAVAVKERLEQERSCVDLLLVGLWSWFFAGLTSVSLRVWCEVEGHAGYCQNCA